MFYGLSKDGVENIKYVSSEYFATILDDSFILENFEKIDEHVPNFSEKANSGEITDTVIREAFGDALGEILINRPWPIYKDGKDFAEKFYREYFSAVRAYDGIEPVVLTGV